MEGEWERSYLGRGIISLHFSFLPLSFPNSLKDKLPLRNPVTYAIAFTLACSPLHSCYTSRYEYFIGDCTRNAQESYRVTFEPTLLVVSVNGYVL